MKNPLARFIIGLVMLVAGLYWFMANVTVHTDFGIRLFGRQFGMGLVVVPFIAGIIWLFTNVDSFGAKLLTLIGVVIIIAAIIMNIDFYFRPVSLYQYLIMLIMIFGGGALVGQVLFKSPKEDKKDKKD